MARVTVEDCVLKIPNRFELVMLAAQRAREIASGAQIGVERDDDKNPVVSLREIADDRVDPEVLRNSLIKGLQKHVEHDEPEDDGEIVIGDPSWPQGAGGDAISREVEEDMSVDGEEAVEVEAEADVALEAEEPDLTDFIEEPEA